MKMLSCVTGNWVYFGRTKRERQIVRVKAMRVAIWCAVHAIEKARTDEGGNLVMYTLTYADANGWAPKDISRFVRWLRDDGVIHYCWVCELQKRGAPHYHVCALLPSGSRWVKPTEGNGGWARGFTWVTPDIRYPWYILKYVQKGQDSEHFIEYPTGTRMYGIARRTIRSLQGQYELAYNRLRLPHWYREGAKDVADTALAHRVSGGIARGGWVAITPFRRTDYSPIDNPFVKG